MPDYIPYLNLKALNQRFREKDFAAMNAVLDAGQVIGGKYVLKFEDAFADYCGVNFCVTTGNGHDALMAILKADAELSVLPKNAKILLPAHTYIATFLSIINAGMTPVPVDVDGLVLTKTALENNDQTIDGIVVVDFYGKIVGDEVYAFAKANNIPIYCDTAQSHGGVNNSGKRSGSLARASAFSFYPTKNLGALGDAGAVTTNDEQLAEMIGKICNYGRDTRYKNSALGFNSRMDTLQAAFLLNRMPTLDSDNKRRKQIAEYYRKHIKNQKVKLPEASFYKACVFHVFPVYVEDRQEFRSYLDKNGIGTSCHYEIPPHQQKVFKNYNWGSFPVTEKYHSTQVSLPCHPMLSDLDLQRIVEVINAY
jgi:dTDP-4-amino-4,6-dideoxygalactose transaminase